MVAACITVKINEKIMNVCIWLYPVINRMHIRNALKTVKATTTFISMANYAIFKCAVLALDGGKL
jgi:hypothetical protein